MGPQRIWEDTQKIAIYGVRLVRCVVFCVLELMSSIFAPAY